MLHSLIFSSVYWWVQIALCVVMLLCLWRWLFWGYHYALPAHYRLVHERRWGRWMLFFVTLIITLVLVRVFLGGTP